MKMSFQFPESSDDNACLFYCQKCKGLFSSHSVFSEHVQHCDGDPQKAPCHLFACERKCYMQLVPLPEEPDKVELLNVESSSIDKNVMDYIPVPAQPVLDKDSFLNDPALSALQGLPSPNILTSGSSSYPCIAGDLLGSAALAQDETSGSLLTNIEECPQLQYLDLAKKDPLYLDLAKKDPLLSQGQHPQFNFKDPFLINATTSVKAPIVPTVAKVSTRSCEDLQTSPTFQDSNYFTFPSNFDESTQLDYLDLATLDLYINNPSLGGTYGSAIFKPLERVPLDKDGNYNADELDQNYPCHLPMSEPSLSPPREQAQIFDTLIETSTSQPPKTGNNKQGSKDHKRRKVKSTTVRKRRKSEGGNVVKKRPHITYNQKILDMKEKLVGIKGEEKSNYKAVVGENGILSIKKILPETPVTSIPELLDDNSLFRVEKVAGRALHSCKQCDYKSYTKTNMDKHIVSHCLKETKQCPHCEFRCTEEVILKTHLQKHDKDNLCYMCGERFTDKAMLTNHLTKHTGKYKYQCPQCEYCTNLKSGYEDHQRKHAGCFLHCDVEGCDFKTIYRRVLNQHLQKHEGLKKHVCDQCGFVTDEMGVLKRHMAVNHDNDKNFKCPHCSYLCVSRYGVVQHVRSKHFKVKQYQCNQCSYRTGYSSGLRFHLMAHAGIKPFKCSACDYHSTAVGKVTRHINTMHTDMSGVTVEKLGLMFQLDAKQFKRDLDLGDSNMIEVIELTEEEKQKLAAENKKNKGRKSQGRRNGDKVNGNSGHGEIDTETDEAISISPTTSANETIIEVSEPLKTSSETLGDSLLESCEGEEDLLQGINTIKMPGPSGTMNDFIVAYQCRRCLLLYTHESDLQLHIEQCKETPLSEIVDIQS